ncbi:MAG: hypothetical protein EOM52_02045 [Clostridia bacterium]|nr:hypothetical protein [Clostridia bacterium]
MEPQYPGVVERYVNVGECYDKAGLGDVRREIMSCMNGYQECYQRAYRCLGAAEDILEDMRSILLTPAVETKIMKRARGILSREIRRTGGGPGRITRRFLSGVTHQGLLCLFETADVQCKRVYELSDSYGLAHIMLSVLLSGVTAAGHDVIACPSPMDPDRLEHLLIPSLSLAFVTSSPALPYEKRPYRRVRLDAMVDEDAAHRGKARLRFSRKVSAALIGEAVDSLTQAKAMHDELEALYNPYVDFDRVHRMADDISEELSGK